MANKRPVVWRVWRLQFGNAFTVPIGGKTFIFVRAPGMLPVVNDAGWRYLHLHELKHAEQVERMGVARYWLRVVLWARLVSLIKHRNLYAVDDPYEQEAYKAAGQSQAKD